MAVLIFDIWILNLIGCATTIAPLGPTTVSGIEGIYHRIDKGETLWRLSKIYAVDLKELVRINKIGDATKIEKGQLIFIPQIKDIPSETSQTYLSKIEDFIWPVKGTVISSFGQNYNNAVNKGINIQAPFGKEIVASRSGIVSFYAQDLDGWGKTVIIQHGDGFLTVYARLSSVTVKIGESVARGTPIGKAGNAGKDKNNYLHFEIRKSHIPHNPYYYLS